MSKRNPLSLRLMERSPHLCRAAKSQLLRSDGFVGAYFNAMPIIASKIAPHPFKLLEKSAPLHQFGEIEVGKSFPSVGMI